MPTEKLSDRNQNLRSGRLDILNFEEKIASEFTKVGV